MFWGVFLSGKLRAHLSQCVLYRRKLPSISSFYWFRLRRKRRFWMKDKGANYTDTNTSLAQLDPSLNHGKQKNAKDCFHAKWTLVFSWGKESTVQVQLFICVSMALSLGFVNSTGVAVIVSHNPDTPRCYPHRRTHTHFALRCLCEATNKVLVARPVNFSRIVTCLSIFTGLTST